MKRFTAVVGVSVAVALFVSGCGYHATSAQKTSPYSATLPVTSQLALSRKAVKQQRVSFSSATRVTQTTPDYLWDTSGGGSAIVGAAYPDTKHVQGYFVRTGYKPRLAQSTAPSRDKVTFTGDGTYLCGPDNLRHMSRLTISVLSDDYLNGSPAGLINVSITGALPCAHLAAATVGYRSWGTMSLSKCPTSAVRTVLLDYQNLSPILLDRNVRERIREQLFRSDPSIQPYTVAAIMGQYYWQSGMNSAPSLLPSTELNSYGLLQWGGDYLSDLRAFAAYHGRLISDLDLQVQFTIYQLGKSSSSYRSCGRSILQDLDSAKSLPDAVWILAQEYIHDPWLNQTVDGPTHEFASLLQRSFQVMI